MKTQPKKQKNNLYKTTTESIDANKIVEHRHITGTPIMAHKMDNKWFITSGDYKADKFFDSFEQAVEYVNIYDWELITIAMMAICKTMLNTQKP